MDQRFPSFLFHRQKFVFRNTGASVVRFHHQSAEIYFSKQEQKLVSLNTSPFGGFLTDRAIKKEDLYACLDEIYGWSKTQKIVTVVIRMFPDAYYPQLASLVKDVLLESQFEILYEDIAQYIPVGAEQPMDLDTHKRRRLRASDTLGYQFRILSAEALERCYELFVQSRINKGYPITMSLDALLEMFALFPDEYLLFGLFNDENVIAASVAIKVSDQILYCFYIGDDLGYRAHSPVTTLVAGIYEYCRENNFSMLDLGLSTDKGIVNKGLYNFKKSFGALESPKMTFIKNFE